MSDQDTRNPDSQDENLEQSTGGFAGQTGYNTNFSEGQYVDNSAADDTAVDDRAGSYEKGYGTPDRETALTPQSPRDPIGDDEPSNNYTEGRELNPDGDLVVED